MIFSRARLRALEGPDDGLSVREANGERLKPRTPARSSSRRHVSQTGDTYTVTSTVLGAPYSLGGPAIGLVFTRAEDRAVSIARIRADTKLHALAGDELEQILKRSELA